MGTYGRSYRGSPTIRPNAHDTHKSGRLFRSSVRRWWGKPPQPNPRSSGLVVPKEEAIPIHDRLNRSQPNRTGTMLRSFASRHISRVLSWAIIHLGRQLLGGSSDRTRKVGGQRHAFPIRSCCGWGLPGGLVTAIPGGLLHHHFALTGQSRRYVSVALSLRSPSLGVTQHPALRSSDFPQARRPATACSTRNV